MMVVKKNAQSLKYASEALRNDRDVVLAAILGRSKRALAYASEALKNDKEFVLAAMKQCSRSHVDNEPARILERVPSFFLSDPDVVLSATRVNADVFAFASDTLKSDKEFAMRVMQQHHSYGDLRCDIFRYLSSCLKLDRLVVLHAIANGNSVLPHFPYDIDDRVIVLAAVEQDGLSLEFASSGLKMDRVVVTAAVKQNGLALEFAPDLNGDREIVRLAVAQYWRALRYASPNLRQDKDIAIFAIGVHGCAMEYIASELRADKHVVLSALDTANIDHVVDHTPKELFADKDVVLRIVKFSGMYLSRASGGLRNDYDVVLAAVSGDSKFARFPRCAQPLCCASTALRNNKRIVMVAVSADGRALEHASDELKCDRDVVLAAIKQTEEAVRFVDASIVDTLEVQLTLARHVAPTAALAAVRKLRKLPDWVDREKELACAVEMLEAFPHGPNASKAIKSLHYLVENMVKTAYKPRQKRDRDAFEADFPAAGVE
jgi:hypothetical protein